MRSQYGYTHRPGQALRHEPEAVGADVQRQLTVEAMQRARAAERETWLASRARLQAELDHLRGQPFSRAVASDLGVLKRMIARLDAKLA